MYLERNGRLQRRMVLQLTVPDTVACGLSSFLIVIDADSKWIDAFPMATATAMTTIQRLRKLFAQSGIPESIVWDNSPQFIAGDFQEFCQLMGIHHVRVAPYQPYNSSTITNIPGYVMFSDGEKVLVKRQSKGEAWLPGQFHTHFSPHLWLSNTMLNTFP